MSFSQTDCPLSLPLLSRQKCPSSKVPTGRSSRRRARRRLGRRGTHRPAAARSLSVRFWDSPASASSRHRCPGQVSWVKKGVRGEILGRGAHRRTPPPQHQEVAFLFLPPPLLPTSPRVVRRLKPPDSGVFDVKVETGDTEVPWCQWCPRSLFPRAGLRAPRSRVPSSVSAP